MESTKLALLCRDLADNKKAENTVILDVRNISSITDYFVITSGETDSGMPGTVYEGHGIGVDLAIETDYNNQQIAKEFRVSSLEFRGGQGVIGTAADARGRPVLDVGE